MLSLSPTDLNSFHQLLGESMRGTQTKRHNRSAQTSIPRPAGGTPATQQDTQGNDTKQPHRRLTLADDPFAIDSTPGADSGALKETTGEPAWKSSLMTGRPQDDNTAAKSVLVLNGAACFIAGKLASTGEPRVSYGADREDCDAWTVSQPTCAFILKQEILAMATGMVGGLP